MFSARVGRPILGSSLRLLECQLPVQLPTVRPPRVQLLRASIRQQSQWYYRDPRYQRFQQGTALLKRWSQRRTFYYEVGGLGALGGAFYLANTEVVPVSGRRRFNVVSANMEKSMAQDMFDSVMQEFGPKVLPEWDPRTKQVERVLERLIPASGLTDERWEVRVIDEPEEKNAFVIPGGKVFVFTGILPICGNEDGVAAVLGHEIAHNVAHHASERMSQSFFLLGLVVLLAWSLGVPDQASQLLLDVGFMRPGSRKQEAEADYIGLMMMAQSCYDPKAAVGLWSRMAQTEQNAPPQFLSTHPSSHNRQHKIEEWLSEAEDKRQMSDCHSTLDYAQQFNDAFGSRRW